MGTPVLDVFAALTLQPRPRPTTADGSDVSGPTTPLGPGPQRRGAPQVRTQYHCICLPLADHEMPLADHENMHFSYFAVHPVLFRGFPRGIR